mgnify:CR=1 FL=1|tara:strand:+ start:585 stop:842 length:258 start_codon:yes stop_codon:yes gene_type:complete
MTKTKTPEPEITTVEETVAPTPPVVPGIDLQDIGNALNLITAAIKRGAYERSELRAVLDTTDKLETFLSYHAAAQASQHAQKGEK